jgi:hypothetical protein
MYALISLSDLPVWSPFITSRVMSTQILQVTAWLSKTT